MIDTSASTFARASESSIIQRVKGKRKKQPPSRSKGKEGKPQEGWRERRTTPKKVDRKGNTPVATVSAQRQTLAARRRTDGRRSNVRVRVSRVWRGVRGSRMMEFGRRENSGQVRVEKRRRKRESVG